MKRNDEQQVSRRVAEKSNGILKYISGYVNKESEITVQCGICGCVFRRTYHNITTHGFVCPGCEKEKRDSREAKKRAIKELKTKERELKHELKFQEAERKKQERLHSCPVCGALTTRPKYCSDACAHKVHNQTHDARRRIMISTAMVDNDITVEGLFQRDKGICQICGEPCDYNDYVYKDNTFVAGNNYPSVDHIIPLSKGGEHSWSNVRLAHRHCNTLEYRKQLTISP